jgi:hypothetical protein
VGAGVRHSSLWEETDDVGVDAAEPDNDKASAHRSGSNGELDGEE